LVCAHTRAHGSRANPASLSRVSPGSSFAVELADMPVWPNDARRLRIALMMAASVWSLAVGYGLHSLLAYSYTPANTRPAVNEWPPALRESGPRSRPLLVMFVHPHCACSNASVSELAVLMAAVRGRVDARVYGVRVAGADAGWTDTELLHAAERIPGVTVSVDAEGAIARELGASVSGETLLYAADGRRAFRGGLTAARAHEGDNPGRHAVLELLAHPDLPARETPVFGCYLHGSETRP
jgi:hypothetical protein